MRRSPAWSLVIVSAVADVVGLAGWAGITFSNSVRLSVVGALCFLAFVAAIMTIWSAVGDIRAPYSAFSSSRQPIVQLFVGSLALILAVGLGVLVIAKGTATHHDVQKPKITHPVSHPPTSPTPSGRTP
jgi:hypothetical protein